MCINDVYYSKFIVFVLQWCLTPLLFLWEKEEINSTPVQNFRLPTRLMAVVSETSKIPNTRKISKLQNTRIHSSTPKITKWLSLLFYTSESSSQLGYCSVQSGRNYRPLQMSPAETSYQATIFNKNNLDESSRFFPGIQTILSYVPFRDNSNAVTLPTSIEPILKSLADVWVGVRMLIPRTSLLEWN